MSFDPWKEEDDDQLVTIFNKDPKHKHASVRLGNDLDPQGNPRKQWVEYKDGSYEPVAPHGDIRKKKRGLGRPDWWVVDKAPDWKPPKKRQSEQQSTGSLGASAKANTPSTPKPGGGEENPALGPDDIHNVFQNFGSNYPPKQYPPYDGQEKPGGIDPRERGESEYDMFLNSKPTTKDILLYHLEKIAHPLHKKRKPEPPLLGGIRG